MGGGDLNLKKSWHPSTLRNIERVWKAEQKHEAEQQKIEQLQKELAEERAREEIQTFAEDQGVVRKKEEKLDWMYQGPAAMVDRDEYLLGRKIDKTFETLQQIESGKAPENDISDVGSSMFSSQNLSGTATVDMAAKIREDPLFNIMKKEKEQRKNLLTNPVKMKQLQLMLKASLMENEKKKSKKSKKKKKRQENDSDDEVYQKKIKNKKPKLLNSESEEMSSSEEVNKFLRNKKHRERSSNERMSKQYDKYEESHNYSSSSFKTRDSSYRQHEESSHSHKRYHSSKNYVEEDCFDRRSKSSSEHKNSQRRYYKDTKPQKEYISQKRSYNNGDDFNQRENKFSKSDSKKKVDQSERDRLLREMQENAKWREEQRKRNTTRYREEDEREEKVKKMDASDFLKPILSKAAGKGNLEDRVKQKIFSIQRNSAAMDKHFARRE